MSYNAPRNKKSISVRNKKYKIKILETKIKKNPKYDYIKSVVDTGCSISKYKTDMEYVNRNFRVRPNEIFKRMKVTTFVQMLLQIESVNIALSKNAAEFPDLTSSKTEPESAHFQDAKESEHQNGHGSNSRSTLLTVISGFGELDSKDDKITNKKEDLPKKIEQIQDPSPYLLLDLRDEESYRKEHIKTAISYPMTMLSRMLNYEIKEMLSYKAKEGKIVVVYDWDEKNIHQAASTLVERGYKNLVVLSGGLKIAKEHFGTSLITDDPKNNWFSEQNVDLLQKTLDHILNDRNKYARISMSSTASVRSRVSTSDVSSVASTLRSQSCITKPQRAPFRT